MPTVENLPVAGSPVEGRKAAAMEQQAGEMKRHADEMKRHSDSLAQLVAVLAAQSPATTQSPAEKAAWRFERVLSYCLAGQVASSVNSYLDFAQELCDGIDVRYPT